MYTFQLAEVHADLQRHIQCFFSKSMYELRLVLSQCPSLSTDVKPLHNQAGVNSGRERGQSICSCILFTTWMTEVIWIEINNKKLFLFSFFFSNIRNHVLFPQKRSDREEQSWFVVSFHLKRLQVSLI